ncbi:cytochrome P450 [Exophiala viscosa]|uniref:Cytochrome P450 n=1 Tax=Exophiala viscosa TaxID=2486360 RepID=A0AAN6DU86_9EURO|nr:cytochrome P450 [Exophiala viscosa]
MLGIGQTSTWSLWTALALILLAALLRQRYQKGLNRYNGPILASFTSLWRVWNTYRNSTNLPFLAWQEKYGDVIRLGPNMLVFTDPACIKDIYTSGFDKSGQYMVNAGVSQGKIVPNIFSTDDKKWHSQLRRCVSNAFSLTSIVQYEAQVDQTLATFLEKMDSLFVHQKGMGSMDLGLWLQYFAFDVIGKLSYSSSYGILESDGRDDAMIHTISRFFEYVAMVGVWPMLDRLLRKNPILLFLGRHGWYDKPTPTVPYARKQLATRKRNQLVEGSDAENPGQGRQADILQKLLEAQRQQPDLIDDRTLLGLSLSAVNAGSDTVSTALSGILYYLLKHPSAMEKAVKEIHSKLPPPAKSASLGEGVVSYSDGRSLPYLDACIQEGLRLHPPAGGATFERVTPPQGATIAGHFIPGRTTVSGLAYLMNRHKPTFGEDALEYRPERWLDNGGPEEEARLAAMNRAMFVFGIGPHTCLGRNIALLEIYKTIPTILRCFENRLSDPSLPIKISNFMVMNIRGLYVDVKRRDR